MPAFALSSGASFWTVKKAPLTLIANSSSYTSSVVDSRGSEGGDAGIDEQSLDRAELALYTPDEHIQVGQ